ncbi:MAG: coproporphyrinogen III oxidase, partial [Pseudomonadota bacterium]
MDLETRKDTARRWFESLRDKLCAQFELLEAEAMPDLYGDTAPDKFVKTPWHRAKLGDADQGGGTMGMLRGRVFEKAGIHTSTVYGELSDEFRKQIPGAQEDPRFWACGISLI